MSPANYDTVDLKLLIGKKNTAPHTHNSTHPPSASTSHTPTVPLRGSVAPPSSQTLCANEKPTPVCQLINNMELSVCVCLF